MSGARWIWLGTQQGQGSFRAPYEAHLCYLRQVFPPDDSIRGTNMPTLVFTTQNLNMFSTAVSAW